MSSNPIIDSNGNKFWYQNNKLHRLDGPAIECANGNKEWYIDGIRYNNYLEYIQAIPK